jgi:hypothetical protein
MVYKITDIEIKFGTTKDGDHNACIFVDLNKGLLADSDFDVHDAYDCNDNDNT